MFWLIFGHFESAIGQKLSIQLKVLSMNFMFSQISFCELVELMLCKRSVQLNLWILCASSYMYMCVYMCATLLSRHFCWHWLLKSIFFEQTKQRSKSHLWEIWVITPTPSEICWHACLPYHLRQGHFWQETFELTLLGE